jgi:ubiquitin thioesterase ZRANB1
LNGINATSSSTTIKRVPSHVAHQLADEIGKHFLSTIRVRKSLMPCPFVTEFATFSLPYGKLIRLIKLVFITFIRSFLFLEIEELPRPIQRQLLDELLDRNVQHELEIEEVPPVINWSSEVCDGLCSRLYALWNRSAGDCLLDSLMQSTWGIFDKDNILRKALADCLHESNML